MTDYIAVLKVAQAALADAVEKVTYSGEDDEVGFRACCGVVSYKPHSSFCTAKNALDAVTTALEKEKEQPYTAIEAGVSDV